MLKRIRMIQWKLLLNVLILLQTGCDLQYNPSAYESDPLDTRYFTALQILQLRNTRHQAIRSCDNCHAKGSSKRAKKFRKPMPQLCYDCHEDYRTLKKRLHGLGLRRCSGQGKLRTGTQGINWRGFSTGWLCLVFRFPIVLFAETYAFAGRTKKNQICKKISRKNAS